MYTLLFILIPFDLMQNVISQAILSEGPERSPRSCHGHEMMSFLRITGPVYYKSSIPSQSPGNARGITTSVFQSLLRPSPLLTHLFSPPFKNLNYSLLRGACLFWKGLIVYPVPPAAHHLIVLLAL